MMLKETDDTTPAADQPSDTASVLIDQLFILSHERPIDLALNQHLYERTPKVMTAATRADMLRILGEMPTDKRELMLKRIGGMVIDMLQRQVSSTEA